MTQLLNDIDRLLTPRTDWTREEAAEIYRAPFNDLIFAAKLDIRPRRIRIFVFASRHVAAKFPNF